MTYEIEFHTEELIRAASLAADDATALTGLAIENGTKAEAPVRGEYRSFAPAIEGRGGHQVGGTLRRSYTTAPIGGVGSPTGGGDAFANVKDGGLLVGSWLGYSRFVEDGTSKMPARPHFRPAVAREVPKWIERFEAAYEKRKPV